MNGDPLGQTERERPERLGQPQMRALRTLHEEFGRNFAAALSALLRSTVEVKLTSLDQLTFSRFVFSLDSPTCFNVLKAEPLEGNLVLDVNPSILYPIIDRLLGGGQQSAPLAQRPLTEIELRLVSRITRLFLEELRRAWQHVLELSLEVVRVESNPQSAQIAPPDELLLRIGLELIIGEMRGLMNLCIPCKSIERIGSKLLSNSWRADGRRQFTPQSARAIGNTPCSSPVEVRVRLAQTRIGTGELVGLKVGDVITTEKSADTPLEVFVEGVPTFRARPGAYKGHKAILIDHTIEHTPDTAEQ